MAQTGKLIVKNLENAFDHRVIGARQGLFFFDKSSKGSCFFLSRGARIFNKLIDFMRNEYKHRGYEEVITPTIYDCKLWEKSGHWSHYEENMIKLKLADRDYSLKPMNCPAHCLMYYQQLKSRSHNLPIRLADFGALHRNELSGSITGLMRLRRFHQDDAHIFCREDQVESEVNNCLQFANHVYDKFNLPFDVRLSLRPQKYLGTSETWDKAENSLRSALNRSQLSFKEQDDEGAFYGPKIDIVVKDTMDREHQCATIQLDLQLPERFDLKEARNNDMSANDDCGDTTRPVIIHRAILGSVERFMAILAENWRGRWPFWLSPLQAFVIPIHEEFNEYASKICQQLRDAQFWADTDLSSATYKSKIRDASLMPYNLILVVGKREAETYSVTSRCSNTQKLSTIRVPKLIEFMEKLELDKTIQRADIELEKICSNS